MIIGRIAAGLTVYVLVLFSHINIDPFLYVKGSILTGIPEIVIQIILVPIIIRSIKAECIFHQQQSSCHLPLISLYYNSLTSSHFLP